jgi:hypothetical protein
MKLRSMTVLAALAAMLAVGAIGSASASAAQPEFTGSFPNKFEAGKGSVWLETEGKSQLIRCQKSAISGEITASNTASAKGTFSECTLSGEVCTTEGAGAGDILTKTLPVKLVYLSKEHKEVGLDFNWVEPKLPASPQLTFATFACGGIQHFTIKGQLIGKITPVNTKATKFSLIYRQSNGIQEIRKSEGSFDPEYLTSSINGGEALGIGVEMTEVSLQTAHETEIKA